MTNSQSISSADKMTNNKICVLCDKTYEGYGCNPQPLADEGECCDDCDRHVLKARMNQLCKFYQLPSDMVRKIRRSLNAKFYVRARSEFFPHGRIYFLEGGKVYTRLLNKAGVSIPSTQCEVMEA